jgi:hypothetical protein
MPKNKQFSHKKQSGGSKIYETLQKVPKTIKSTLDNVSTIVTQEVKQKSECGAGISFYIAYYLSFYIFPFIIIFTSIWYIIEILINFVPSSKTDFYEDILIYREVPQISNIPFANMFLSRFSITMVIVVGLYIVSMLALYFLKNKLKTVTEPDKCNHFSKKLATNSFPSLLFFGMVGIILIVDFAVYGKYYSNVGESYRKFDTKISTHLTNLRFDIANNSTATIINMNTSDNLKSYVNEQLDKITDVNKTNIPGTEIAKLRSNANYKNIVNAYITYGIIKTIEQNGYHSKKKKASKTNFFTSQNLFLSINKNTNRLIHINYVNDLDDFIRYDPLRCSKTSTAIPPSHKTVLDYVFEDCDNINREIDDIILSIKNTADGTTCSKIVFLSLMIPLIVITLIYTFVSETTAIEKKEEVSNTQPAE